MRHPVNLFVLPIVFYESLFSNNPALLSNRRLQIANIWWEASRLPPRLHGFLARFDALLAMSDFVADMCRNTLPMTPVLLGQHPLNLPPGIRSDRDAIRVPADATLFVASLDPNSDPKRKNPAALITAFRAAFPAADKGVRLVIRLNNASTDVGRDTARNIRQLAHADPRIKLLVEPLSYEQILTLYATADIYISLHRGEGLGLGMLETMALGKPVIATGWSGNLSFMSHINSALLRYRLIPVCGHFDYFHPDFIGPDARWADPVMEDAVAWMRRLRQDPALRRTLGARARADAAEYLARAQRATWIDELDSLWQAQRFLPPVVEKFSHPSKRRQV